MKIKLGIFFGGKSVEHEIAVITANQAYASIDKDKYEIIPIYISKEGKIMMELYEKNGNILYILNILKKYSDAEHMLSVAEIQRKIKEIYNVEIDPRTIRRNINLLKYKLDYDISTRDDNGKGYYLNRDPETDFEPGEIRAIIDNFSYANYIVPSIAKNIIKKCKSIQTIYENEKIKDYHIYANDSKTENVEVIKNIEDISESIFNFARIVSSLSKHDLSNPYSDS